MMSSDRWACPSQRIAWWMRPPPRRCWASTKPSPGWPIRWSAGTRQSSEHQLGVIADPSVLHVGVRHRGDVAHDVEAGSVGGDDEDRRVTVRAAFGVGLGEDQHDVGDRRVGDEPLVPVDHPLVAILVGGRADHGRVGTGEERLRERERAGDLAAKIRPEPPLLLRLGGAVGQQLHVAAVGRLHTEDAHGEHAPADDLRHQGQLELPESRAAELRVEKCAPEPPLLDLSLEVGLHDPPFVAGSRSRSARAG